MIKEDCMEQLEAAVKLLTSAIKSNDNKARRKRVLQAVRHLISWVAGNRQSIPQNAITCNDDDLKYCDLCFSRQKRLIKVDFMDLCKECDSRHPDGVSAKIKALNDKKRKDKISAIGEQVQEKLKTLNL